MSYWRHRLAMCSLITVSGKGPHHPTANHGAVKVTAHHDETDWLGGQDQTDQDSSCQGYHL